MRADAVAWRVGAGNGRPVGPSVTPQPSPGGPSPARTRRWKCTMNFCLVQGYPEKFVGNLRWGGLGVEVQVADVGAGFEGCLRCLTSVLVCGGTPSTIPKPGGPITRRCHPGGSDSHAACGPAILGRPDSRSGSDSPRYRQDNRYKPRIANRDSLPNPDLHGTLHPEGRSMLTALLLPLVGLVLLVARVRAVRPY